MLETHAAKRLEIIIEAPLQARLTRALEKAGAPGYTVLPVFGGFGSSGPWTRDGQVSRASGMVAVVCIVAPEKTEALLEAAYRLLEHQIGVLSIADCEIVRKERF